MQKAVGVKFPQPFLADTFLRQMFRTELLSQAVF